MPMPNERFINGSTNDQKLLLHYFDCKLEEGVRKPQMMMAEWHRRARKTTLAINLLIREAYRVPKAKYVYIAPTQVMARNIVWDDPNMLKAYLPDKREIHWETNEQKMLITFANVSQVKVGGADNPDSLRGIDAVGVVFDEWALIKENTWTEIFRPIIAGPLPPHLKNMPVYRWAMFLYTPKGMNHASVMFDNAACIADGGVLPDCGMAMKTLPNWFVSRLDGEKTGIFSNEELARMREEMPLAFYEQEIKCSRVTQEEMTLITSAMIHKLNEYHAKTTKSIKVMRKIVSIDPAWGGDVCKIMGLVNKTVEVENSIRDRHRTDEIVMAAKLLAQKISTKNFIVDTVNDVGIADALSVDEANYNVQYFKSSHKAKENKDNQYQQAIRFANCRAEAYHYTSQQIANFEAGPIKSIELMRQLPIASRYTTQGGSGRLIIIPKLKIKEELGCSPDEADCYVMGIWGEQHVQPEMDIRVNQVKPIHLVPDHFTVGVG